jgi:hypothetical protein
MDSFYGTFFIQLHIFSTNYIPSCLDSRVDVVYNLDPVSIIFVLFSITTLPHQQKRLCVSIINVHKNYGGVCIKSTLIKKFFGIKDSARSPPLGFEVVQA